MIGPSAGAQPISRQPFGVAQTRFSSSNSPGDRTILRMGYDSLAVVGTYLAGLVVLYFLRSSGGG
jgi:hypothetical protein